MAAVLWSSVSSSIRKAERKNTRPRLYRLTIEQTMYMYVIFWNLSKNDAGQEYWITEFEGRQIVVAENIFQSQLFISMKPKRFSFPKLVSATLNLRQKQEQNILGGATQNETSVTCNWLRASGSTRGPATVWNIQLQIVTVLSFGIYSVIFRGTQREYSSKPLNIALLNVF